jgi:hypothetical protein
MVQPPDSRQSTKFVPIGGLDPRPCSLRARERESLAPVSPETSRSDRHPQLSPQTENANPSPRVRNAAFLRARSVNDTAPATLDEGR